MAPIRIAVAGAGVFGRNHLRVLNEVPGAELAGVFDTDSTRAAEAAAKFNTRVLASLTEFRETADAAIVAVPTRTHADVGCALLESGLDVLVEKPIAPDLASAQRLMDAADRSGRILQVGHLERFNPAVEALEQIVNQPLFFEIHRLSVFSPRSLDIDVVLDLMIHDIEVLLGLTGSMPQDVRAAGLSILSDKVDIANVRLAFDGGCVANLTASRVSTERVRKIRLFQPHQYISLDYQKQEAVAYTVSEGTGGFLAMPVPGGRHIAFEPLPVTKGEPLKCEIAAFLDCVRTRRTPRVDGRQATRALEVALNILAKIEEHLEVVAATLGARATSAPGSPS